MITRKNRRTFLSLALILVWGIAVSQEKKPLDHTVYGTWKQIENQQISNDGLRALYEINPQKGDGFLYFTDLTTLSKDSIARGSKAAFSPGSGFAVYHILPPFDTVRSLQLKKVKKDKMPKDSLGITLFATGKTWRMPGLKSIGLPEESSDWVAIWLETPVKEVVADTTKSDTLVKEKKPKKSKAKKKKTETGLLVLLNPVDGDSIAFEQVRYYSLSDNGQSLAMVKQFGDSIDSLRVGVYLTDRKVYKELFVDQGVSAGISTDKEGKQIAFTYSSDTIKEKNYQLYYAQVKKGEPRLVVGDSSERIKSGWAVSEYLSPWFHEDGKELYFGTAPRREPAPKDTLTDDEKVSVDIWNWQDDRLQPQQLVELERDRKKYFMAVYYPQTDKVVQLANPEMPDIQLDKKSKGRYSLGFNHLPYWHNSSWEAGNYRDVYLVDRETGIRREVVHKAASTVSLDPGQKSILYYQAMDSSWYALRLDTKAPVNLTSSTGIAFFDELNDVPALPGPYGMAGWTGEGKVVVYDDFDLWLLDPNGKAQPRNITHRWGRDHQLRYRYVKLDPDLQVLPETMLLSAFDKKTKDAGFALFEIKEQGQPQTLMMEPARFSRPKKAKNAAVMLWSKESFEQFPDIYESSTTFSNIIRLTDANPQQAAYAWGSVELVEWMNFDGDTLQGLLYKPANFDPKQSYPMLVYFYERYSDDLHRYYTPKPIRSVINFSYYTSNGYVIFIPDIKYKTGFPGKSAYDCIISGTQAMLDQFPFIDRNRLGIQGQSWGGYQTAYLVTQTNMFSAAMAGAPVSNMTSAYGGIRWGSGISRAFQYEQTQSRIGGDLWESLPLYLANSPVFFADRVETPLLIMHNDKDGAVPWYQGIELFNALRRLNKPVWMLVYNGAPHNLKRRADCEDLTVRMQQFFDHYLKGAPEPLWMKKGIPAIEKGKSFGFELE